MACSRRLKRLFGDRLLDEGVLSSKNERLASMLPPKKAAATRDVVITSAVD
jgi:hypothetical protein